MTLELSEEEDHIIEVVKALERLPNKEEAVKLIIRRTRIDSSKLPKGGGGG